jgi:ubiquinone/menaquinone biosynthesis C-methylase UbiE
VNSEPHLQMFPDESLDMIYTNIVLQHLPNTKLIECYIAEFTRILKKEGLLVFQLPSYMPFSRRWQIRKRLYRLLRIVGVNEQYIYKRLGFYPLHMSFIPTKEVVSFLNARGMRVLEVLADTAVPPPVRSCTYYVTKQQ